MREAGRSRFDGGARIVLKRCKRKRQQQREGRGRGK